MGTLLSMSRERPCGAPQSALAPFLHTAQPIEVSYPHTAQDGGCTAAASCEHWWRTWADAAEPRVSVPPRTAVGSPHQQSAQRTTPGADNALWSEDGVRLRTGKLANTLGTDRGRTDAGRHRNRGAKAMDHCARAKSHSSTLHDFVP